MTTYQKSSLYSLGTTGTTPRLAGALVPSCCERRLGGALDYLATGYGLCLSRATSDTTLAGASGGVAAYAWTP